MNKKLTSQQLANKWIKMLQQMGYDYDGMLRVIRLAKRKYLNMKLQAHKKLVA